MIKGGRATVLTFAEKSKNILDSNWQGYLNTVKADAKGSKGEIYTSKVRYLVKRGKPYVWVAENDMHNVNTMIDERGSFAVTSPMPGPLANLLKSIKKLPARVALMGEVLPLKDEKKAPGDKLYPASQQQIQPYQHDKDPKVASSFSRILLLSGIRPGASPVAVAT
ncbi:hypothetical protein A4A49_17571 [Nicotiana attenuata]|uniref:Uncharacterized protein n=1 Tax=Nicotiana attenuata TaxID=49451 RepID=A0A1J6I294_NICAT|nr:hypothetical protein A4A49_17571 [Nicotiana attenuata]